MEYLPSKKFAQRALVIFLLVVGWFYLFGSSSQINKGGSPDTGYPFDQNFLSQQTDLMGKSSLLAITATNTRNISDIFGEMKRTSLAELNIFQGNKLSDFEKYAEDLTSSLRPYSNQDLPNEGEITINVLGSGNAEELKKVSIMGQIHLKVLSDLRSIKVPEEIKFRHLFLINELETIVRADELMLGAFEDPKMAMEAVGLHQSATKRFINSIIDVNKFFESKGINFDQTKKIKIYLNSVE